MVKKLILLAVLSLNLLIIAPVFAQNEQNIPELNTMCWRLSDCEAARKSIGTSGVSGQYFISEWPCVGGDKENPWGKCLAGSAPKTNISFGGQNQFPNLGDFIIKNYNLAITVAAILAVIVIIMSGFQWTMSAGNSEVISKAKHRIGNALIGLSIAYGSFFILSTINPDLVAFDYLRVWMIRPQEVMPKFCSGVPSSTFAYAADSTAEAQMVNPLPFPSSTISYDLKYSKADSTFYCGKRFWVKNGGQNTCFGDFCPTGLSCININLSSPSSTTYYCKAASIYGQVTASYSGIVPCDGFETPYLDGDGNGEIYKVCMVNGGYVYYETNTNIRVNNNNPAVSLYVFDQVSNAEDTSCENGGDFLGYALALELNVNCNPVDSVYIVSKSGTKIGKLTGVTGPAVSDQDLFSEKEINSGTNISVDLINF